MSFEEFTDNQKDIITNLATHLQDNAAKYGGESLARLFITNPGSKAYFSYDENNLESLQEHGKRVITAVAIAARNLNDLKGSLDELATKHGSDLLVDPLNFPAFSRCIQVTLANHLQSFTPAVQLAVDKFLKAVSEYLSSKYR
ncbi:hemoglobin subunit alpha-like [Hemiscyllium ocellatum]|uniref:hemoglobin subunit alpha-like n=1 Tax=Hemiscyllium ocellatum TaxID=170820 RepID=UPI002965FDC5|nr:hemoglobin subunit alpha-like [Hemiscyllium ocellatum]